MSETRRTLEAVIPFYGDPQPTAQLIAQIRGTANTSPLSGIVVADDASPTPAPTPDDLPAGTARVTVVRRERNGGFAAAVNTGIAATHGDYVIVLNSDLTIPEGTLAELVARAAPWMPAIVSCAITSPSGHDAAAGRHFPTVSHQWVEWLTPLARFRHLPALHEAVGHDMRSVRPSATSVDWVVGAVMLMPRDLWEALGGLDEGFYMNCEEVDFQRRARQLGVPSVVLGDVSFLHEGGGSSDSQRRRGWVSDARLRYARKWSGRSGERILQAGLLAATGINAVWNTVRHLSGTGVDPVATARYEIELITHPEQWVPLENRAAQS